MAINYTNTEVVMANASIFMSSQSQLELTAKRPRTAIRAQWKKIGDGWKVVSVQKKVFRGNYVASGNLVKSIRPFAKGLEFGITANWYAEAIRAGRKPWANAKFSGGKGIPIDTMKEWTTIKRLRPRDPSSGQFLKNNETNKKAMRFMMNRKIKYFGIEPFDFKSIAQKSMMAKFKPQIDAAIKLDQMLYLAEKRDEK
jgi:hypothetical protein